MKLFFKSPKKWFLGRIVPDGILIPPFPYCLFIYSAVMFRNGGVNQVDKVYWQKTIGY